MIIIPDVHGRTFWKSAVEGRNDEEVIFLGDYVDPYTSLEEIAPQEGLRSLLEIIEYKKQHMGNVVLLLGNHDLSYITSSSPKCRHDYENHNAVEDAILENFSLFNIAHEKVIANRQYIFTHAGILPHWLQENELVLGSVRPANVVAALNKEFKSRDFVIFGDVSFYRGGNCEIGSCLWADIDEHFDYIADPNAVIYSDIYQIFGHTLQLSGQPIITPHFACLDCRKAFRLDDEGVISEI